jgi:hypothetical protein
LLFDVNDCARNGDLGHGKLAAKKFTRGSAEIRLPAPPSIRYADA